MWRRSGVHGDKHSTEASSVSYRHNFLVFFKQTATDMTRLCIRFSYKHLTDRTLLCFDELSQ